MDQALETLDLRSVGITLSLCGFALTAVLWAARRDGDDIDGLGLWVVSAVTMSAGLGLSSLYGWIPDWASRIVGNTLLSLAPVLVWQVARRFHGKTASCAPAVLVAVLTLVWGLAFVLIWPSGRARGVLPWRSAVHSRAASFYAPVGRTCAWPVRLAGGLRSPSR